MLLDSQAHYRSTKKYIFLKFFCTRLSPVKEGSNHKLSADLGSTRFPLNNDGQITLI